MIDNHFKVTLILGEVKDEFGTTLFPNAYNDSYIDLSAVLDYYDISSAYQDMEELRGLQVTRVTYDNGIPRDVILPLDKFNEVLLKYKQNQDKWLIRSKFN